MADEPRLNADQVAEWLHRHPDFFVHHPDLLAILQLPHDTGATSLLEYQLKRLREDNDSLREKLQQLVGIAGENERLLQRLHDLTLELMATDDLEAMVVLLSERLENDFQIESVRLLLIDTGNGGDHIRPLPAPVPDWIGAMLDNGRPHCGRLTRAKAELVFGGDTGAITSAAIVPVADLGMLAIGSRDGEKFFPGMGTLFLERLAATLAFRLRRGDAGRRKRA